MSVRLVTGEPMEVPPEIGHCPECGSGLYVISYGSDVNSGKPLAVTLHVECEDDFISDEVDDEDFEDFIHGYSQALWDPIVKRVQNWVEAVE